MFKHSILRQTKAATKLRSASFSEASTLGDEQDHTSPGFSPIPVSWRRFTD